MTDRQSFIEAIKADPEDDAPRLIYADWLDGVGDMTPREFLNPERAEFIRVQCELARIQRELRSDEQCDNAECDCQEMGELRRRERELWRAGTRFDFKFGGNFAWSRGFLDSIACSAADWLTQGDAILREHPVQTVRLATCPAWEPVAPGAGCRLVGDPLQKAFTSADHDAARLDRGDLASRLLKLRWPTVKTWHLPEIRYGIARSEFMRATERGPVPPDSRLFIGRIVSD